MRRKRWMIVELLGLGLELLVGLGGLLGCSAPSQQIAKDVAVARSRSDRLLREVAPTCKAAADHERCERLVACLSALGEYGSACEPGISAKKACGAAEKVVKDMCREWP